MELWKALAHLFPAAVPLRDYELRDDGQGPYIARWDLPDPQPTLVQLTAASAAYDAAAAAAAQAAAQLRQQIVTVAQSAVGVPLTSLTALTANQVRALLAVLLWRAGAVRADTTVRPLGEWADRA